MKRLCEWYFKLARVLLALFLVGMVVLVFGNVVLRYAFNSGLTISEELSRIFFVWILSWAPPWRWRTRPHRHRLVARTSPARSQGDGVWAA